MDKDILSLLICLYCDDENRDLELMTFSEKENDVVDGILYCPDCHRYYMIHDSIAYLTLDAKRNKKDEIRFMKRYKASIPGRIKDNLKPVWE